ncbi:MAG: hypothetical protein AABX45_00425 [Nanoarchaeota archaeon]
MVNRNYQRKYLDQDYFNEFVIISLYLYDSRILKDISTHIRDTPIKKYFEKYPDLRKKEFGGGVLKKIKTLDEIVDELNELKKVKSFVKHKSRIKKLYNKARKIIYER